MPLKLRSTIIVASAFACGKLLAQSPTWSDDAACIIYTHCTPCHHDGGVGHFSLVGYDNAFFWRNEIRAATQSGLMPPWPPDPSYRPLAHERLLTQEEIDILAAWVDGGAAPGDLSGEPPPPVYASGTVITDPDITAIMPDYVIPASAADLYRCFVLPIENPTDTYITGLEVVPGNREMVHHVLVYQDPTGQAQALDEADIEPGYISFGGIGVDEAKLVGIWVPGSEPFFTPPGMGIKLDAGADLVIQVHYPATSNVEVDSTRVNIQLSDGGFIRELTIDPILNHATSLTNGPLIIPPNEVRTFHAQYTVPINATITAIGPHAHLVCRSMRAWAVKPGGEIVDLIDIPNWDFRWQDIYAFQNPIYLPAGTVVHGEAMYDNTPANPNLPGDVPQWVFLGEATTDEMMLFYFAWTYGFPSDEAIVIDDGAHAPHYLDCEVDFNVSMTETDGPRTDAWPIPARQSLFVQFTGMGDAVLFDMTGRAVRSYPLADPVTELDVSSLARGTYLLRLRDRSTSAVHPMKVVLE
jgi:hypothetical protein